MSNSSMPQASNPAERQPARKPNQPFILRSLQLNFIGDWGQANFHRILGWLTQEVCSRSGPRSRVGIWSIRDGGIEALPNVSDGEADLCIATPAGLLSRSITGEGIFDKAMPDLRALATLPQNDRMVFALDPKFGIKNFEELRQKKLPLRIATSINDGTNFIGYVAYAFMEAHGISKETLESWGGAYVTPGHRPDDSLNAALEDDQIDAVLQEAIMTPWWADLIKKRDMVPLAAEAEPLKTLSKSLGLSNNPLPAGFWESLDHELPALDFSDFVIIVRSDLPDDVAHLLTWCLVETRAAIEKQYHHIPPQRSPLSYPLIPERMAKTPLPLHPGARRYYQEAGHLRTEST